MGSSDNGSITTIDTILQVNNKSSVGRGTPYSPTPNFIKTITNRYRSESNIINVVEDFGYGSISDVFDIEGNDSILNSRINEFRTMSRDRYSFYSQLEEMSQDPIISSVLDLYAEDSTQRDTSGTIAWIQGEDTKEQSIIQSIFDKLDIESKLWQISRLLALYGDVYIELFYDDTIDNPEVTLLENKLNKKVDYTTNLLEVEKLVHKKSDGFVLDRFEIVRDIEHMFDLTVQGKTVAHARVIEPDTQNRICGYTPGGNGKTGYYTVKNSNDVRYYPPDKFVHFYIENSTSRNCEMYVVDLGNGKQFRFNIKQGRSMIQDVFSTNKDLQLLEYSIMLNRVSRSSVLRVAQVEVGSMPKSNVQMALRKIKQIIENKVTMNISDGTYKPYLSPGPVENFIYVPTREGKGAINFSTVGGDVNIRDIADLEYYQNKQFAGLKVPKSFLNYNEGLASFGGGGGLTKQDARYARTVKRLQGFIINGLHDFMNIVLDSRGLSRLTDRFEVKMVVPSSVEDEERDAIFSNRMELCKSFLEIMNSVAEAEGATLDMDLALDYLCENIFDDPTIKDLFIIEHENVSGEGFGDVSGRPVDVDEPMGTSNFGGGTDFNPKTDSIPSNSGSSETQANSNISGEFGGEWKDIEI